MKKNCTAGRTSDWNYSDYSTESQRVRKQDRDVGRHRKILWASEWDHKGKDGSEAIFEEIMTPNFLQVMKHKFLIFLKAEHIKKKSYLDTF